MLYAVSDASFPLQFLSVGNLLNENSFLHPRRTLDSFEFITVTCGCLHIHAGAKDYDIHPGEFLILFPEQCHYGYRPSEGPLSFYWTHFYVTGPEGFFMRETSQKQLLALCESETGNQPYYIFPEHGRLPQNSRTNILFIQLLDLSRRAGFFAANQCSYAQSTLLLELANECFLSQSRRFRQRKLPANAAAIAEWLQLNYDTRLSVSELAQKFGYHPSYLAALFKRSTGQTIIEYLNHQRIHAAENLLMVTPKISIAQISEQVGFSDEKYFMKLFKRYNGLTPTAYRDAFSEKFKNRY